MRRQAYQPLADLNVRQPAPDAQISNCLFFRNFYFNGVCGSNAEQIGQPLYLTIVILITPLFLCCNVFIGL